LTNRRPQEVCDEVFWFVLQLAAGKKLPADKTVGVDSTPWLPTVGTPGEPRVNVGSGRAAKGVSERSPKRATRGM